MVNALLLNSQFAVTRLPYYFKLKSLKLIRPRHHINFESQYYKVKTIDTADELAEVMKLRFEVFFREFSQLPSMFSFFPYDMDLHDFICDHLVVIDKGSDRVVACYRLLLSASKSKFYSETEFDLSDFLKAPGEKLELGRACVHKDFRSGPVISLLWKGLMEYARQSKCRYLFGCSSIAKKDIEVLPFIMEDLHSRSALVEDYDIKVRPEYLPPSDLCVLDERPKTRSLGSLMNMYLLAGAKFSKTCAYDKEMDCLDLMTILDLTKMPASFERKFG